MKGRKNGCPTNIRDWSIFIQDKTQVNETWIRIKGLTQMTRGTDADTEDGSAATDSHEEPYVTKRSGSLTIEGRPIVDAVTGDRDAGQSMLNDYAEEVGCDGDCTIKIVDPYGAATVADYIVTSTEDSSDETEDSVSWDLEQVGEAERLVYVQMTSVSLKDGNDAASEIALTVGGTPKTITVVFNPENASNQRFRVRVNDPATVAVSNIGPGCFDVSALKAGEATVTVISMNGRKTAALTVTAEDAE